MPDAEFVLEVEDMFGSIVRFYKINYDNHKDKHPELRQKQFCPGQIKMALQNPHFTIQGNQDGTLCYYFELFRIRDIIKLVKVVVRETDRLSKNDPHCVIMTAFKTDHVQELKYGIVPTYYNGYRGL
jgi:hypothetical protein